MLCITNNTYKGVEADLHFISDILPCNSGMPCYHYSMRYRAAFISILVLVFLASCVTNRFIRTEPSEYKELAGNFTLILYGSRHLNDIETVVILDMEGDKYSFEPYAPEFDYKIKKGVPAKEALKEAEHFVSWHSSFHRTQLSRIIDEKGVAIGYEMRPLYYPLAFGVSDVLDVYYIKEGDKITVRIKLIPSVERMLFDGDGFKLGDN
ncbi:MAG: hypothetical protein A2Z82_08850 [Nitrospirae bacterium GWA2_46_11]|nr:MAG: hypothetical protein A2Z82_08850 [Nitrospirae bacterium GWA2_46_11]